MLAYKNKSKKNLKPLLKVTTILRLNVEEKNL